MFHGTLLSLHEIPSGHELSFKYLKQLTILKWWSCCKFLFFCCWVGICKIKKSILECSSDDTIWILLWNL